jgi:hypothetical protein
VCGRGAAAIQALRPFSIPWVKIALRHRTPLPPWLWRLGSSSAANPLVKLRWHHHEAMPPMLPHVDCRQSTAANLGEDAATTNPKHGRQLAHAVASAALKGVNHATPR